MAIFEVATKDPAYTAEVGWARALPGYWFALYDQGGRTVSHGGVEYPIGSLYDLVAKTVGVLDWGEETATLRKLRDAPWREQAAEDDGSPVSDVLLRALGRVA
jgi:hypothetical protein